MQDRSQWLALTRKVMDAVDEAVKGSEWGPPESEPSVMTECVVVMGWTDGGYTETHLRIGSSWGTEGLIRRALREIVDADGAPAEDD